ncbi:MarR family winged helix-turn-helix transcriptional regulator [Marinobacter halodurans]|uniref:MarR family winged helix-turn-helix transcriptional regulator n=1 Tax=Marinobacter halodurans TaxID=2528979 RepID=UPI001A95597D|nr:MarR family transcriptional regulator [Marinobacter halodurans]
MSKLKKDQRKSREDLLARLAKVGREHSDATVLFHATVARLLGLNATDYKTLGALDREGPMTAGDIAKHTGLATASVTNLVDRLEKKGYVRRISDPADRRRVVVAPAAEAVDRAERLLGSTRQSLTRLYEDYSESELAVIADFLSRNAERLRTETGKLGSNSGASRT